MPALTKADNVKAVIGSRRRYRNRLVKAFGGKCGICGYDRCIRNLAFHHVDPKKKTFSFGAYQSKPWKEISDEARKCVMLCHNCHGEVHHGLITNLDGCPRFDEAIAAAIRDAERVERRAAKRVARPKKPTTRCHLCGTETTNKGGYCCRKCAREARKEPAVRAVGGRVIKQAPKAEDLSRDLKALSCDAAGRKYDVTGKTIRKWAHRYGISLPGWGVGRITISRPAV